MSINRKQKFDTMNWGKAIVLSFILFASFIGIMAYKMGTSKVDLVQNDYYQKEIDFQEHINRMLNSKRFKKFEIMKYSPESQEIRICFPTPVDKGKITFYRPSNKDLDFTLKLENKALFFYSTEMLEKGKWKIQAYWTYNKLDYFLEEELIIQ